MQKRVKMTQKTAFRIDGEQAVMNAGLSGVSGFRAIQPCAGVWLADWGELPEKLIRRRFQGIRPSGAGLHRRQLAALYLKESRA